MGAVRNRTVASAGLEIRVQVRAAYVRDGALFYSAADEPEGATTVIPLDRLYEVHIGPEET